jgi:hypothetical protein
MLNPGERLTREQIDEILPTYKQLVLLGGGSAHVTLFALCSFVCAFGLDTLQFAQVVKAAGLDQPFEFDGDWLQSLNHQIDGEHYQNPSQFSQLFGRYALIIATKASMELLNSGDAGGSEDDAQD